MTVADICWGLLACYIVLLPRLLRFTPATSSPGRRAMRRGRPWGQKFSAVDSATGTDVAMMASHQGPSGGSFEKFYEKYKKLVLYICYGILRHEQDAADASQNAWLEAHQKFGTCKSNPKGWIETIARNKALDAFRKRRRLGANLDDQNEPLDMNANSPEHSLTAGDLRVIAQKYKAIIENLDYEIFIMLADGWTYEKIAKDKNISSDALRQRITQATKKIYAHIWKKDPGRGQIKDKSVLSNDDWELFNAFISAGQNMKTLENGLKQKQQQVDMKKIKQRIGKIKGKIFHHVLGETRQ